MTPRITKTQSASLEVVVWGSGPRVVLVHGSVFNGPLTWREQRPLGERWRLEASIGGATARALSQKCGRILRRMLVI